MIHMLRYLGVYSDVCSTPVSATGSEMHQQTEWTDRWTERYVIKQAEQTVTESMWQVMNVHCTIFPVFLYV